MHSSKTHNGRIRAAQSRVTSPASSASPSVSVSPAPPAAGYSDEDEVSTAGRITASGRAVAPLPLQTPNTYQSLVSTLSALGPIASGSTKTVGYWGKQAYEQLASSKRRLSEGGHLLSLSRGSSSTAGSTPHVAPAPDVDRASLPGIDEDDGDAENDEHTMQLDEQLSASIHHRPSSSDDPVRYSSWDALPNKTRVLIQVFESGRLKVWDASTFSELVEVLNVDTKLIASHTATPLSAKFLPFSPPDGHVLLGTLTSDNTISIYSTVSHRVIKRLSASHAGQIVDFQVNDRFLVAATVQPLALHIWQLSTLEAAPFSPLCDVAPHPYDLTPVYCLSSSRLLAYASTTSPAYGGSGIIATSGWNEQDGSGQPSNATNGQPGNVYYGETARRWGEGMMSHMKSVTDYGYSRYYGSQAQGATGSGSTGLTPPSAYHYAYRSSSRPASSAKNFSKSAPHSMSPFHSRSPEPGSLASSPASGTTRAPSYSPRPASSGPTSSSVAVVDLVASSRSSQLSRPSPAQRSRFPQNAFKGAEGLIHIAHFRPSKNHQLTLLSINPNGTLILTSSSEGHSFHVFEVRPPSFAGNSSIRTVSPSRDAPAKSNPISMRGNSLRTSNAELKVWHRYRLNRGLTVARTIAAHWSADSRFVLVSTRKGTVHVYPVHPLGGKPTPESHLPVTVKNPSILMPLSVTVSAVARIKAPRLPSNGIKDENDDSAAVKEAKLNASASPPNMLFVPMTSLPMQGLSRSVKANTSNNSRTEALVLFYPHLHSILQTNLLLSASPKTASSDAPLSTRVTSQAVSGLTQMMRNRGSALPTFESEVLLARQEWQSQWPLAREENVNDEDIRVDLSKIDSVGSTMRNERLRSTSAHEAEIESFSHAPAVLPRSIYLAQTVTSHMYPPTSASEEIDIARQFSVGNFTIGRQLKVVVRQEVSHRFGSRAGEPFDESTELHSAMHTILDASNLSSSNASGQAGHSPMSNSPAFPNGYRQSSSSSKWLPSPSLASLPIPIGISPSTVRQAATKVRKYSSSVRSPRLQAVGSGHSLQSSTLSFEDDDAVLAQVPSDMLEIEEEGIDLGRPQHVAARLDKYGSPSPAPVPSLSVGTASSAESQAKSADSPLRPRSQHDAGNSPPLHASMIDDEVRNEGDWDSFKLEGIDDEEDLKASLHEQVKTKAPSPLLSHAMLPLLAAKAEQTVSSRVSLVKDRGLAPLPVLEDQSSILSAPRVMPNQTLVQAGNALDMATKPLEPEPIPSVIDAVLISPTLGTHRDATPSPLSSSPAVSSAAEFSASPATAAVLAKQKKKKAKKGQV